MLPVYEHALPLLVNEKDGDQAVHEAVHFQIDLLLLRTVGGAYRLCLREGVVVAFHCLEVLAYHLE